MSEFRVEELLCEIDDFSFYRATHEPTEKELILRTVKQTAMWPNKIEELYEEFQFYLDYAVPYLLSPLKLDNDTIIFKHVKGSKLKHTRPLNIETFLTVAMQLTDVYIYMHEKEIVGKRYILDQLWITTDQRLQIFPLPAYCVNKVYRYSTPEFFVEKQEDERSDLYRLGVLFYELLVGKTPFQPEHAKEWAHQHLAVYPESFNTFRQDIPKSIQDMIMCLLAKDPAKRYQSALGLRQDLKMCSTIIKTGFSIPSFRLSTAQQYKFQLPTHLYGREKEARQLYEIYKQASLGCTELVYLTGAEGMGKSSLIMRLFKKMISEQSFFISGKFDQLTKNVPYESFIQLFRELVHQILSKPDDEVAYWSKRIQEAIENNGNVLTDVIPELSFIIGEQPTMEALSPVDAERRFAYVFRKFVQVFTSREKPLIMFLDDIHWADQASLRLMHALLTDPNSQSLVVIAAYRDNHYEQIQDKLLTNEELEEKGVHVTTIGLSLLTFSEIRQLIADALSSDKPVHEQLVQLIYRKTAGNPFYLMQLLKIIYTNGWLVYDHSEEGWKWDLDAIEKIQDREQIIQMMLDRVKQLPLQVKDIFMQASCLGHSFSEAQLIQYLQMPESDVVVLLQTLEQAGLLIRSEQTEVVYHFFHDRIQNLANGLIDEKRKQQIHLAIGRDLLSTETFSYEMVNHLNIGSPLINEPNEFVRLMELNVKAGRMAANSSAYDMALHYFHIADSFIGDAEWKQDDAYYFSFYLDLAETEYLCGNYVQADKLYKDLIERAQNWTEKAHVYSKQLNQLVNQGNYSEAIEQGLQFLAEAGVRLSANPSTVVVKKEVYWTKARLPKQLTDLKQLPEVSNQRINRIMDIMVHLIMPTFFTNKKLNAILSCKLMRYTLSYGQTQVTPAVYAGYATLLCTEYGAFEKGYKIGKIAVDIADASQLMSVRTKAYVLYGGVLCQWYKHRKEGIPYLEQAIGLGLHSGDFVYTSYAVGAYINSIYTYEDVPTIWEENQKLLTIIDQTKEDFVGENMKLFMQVSLCLQGQTENKFSFNDRDFREEEFLAANASADSQHITLFQYYTYKTQVHFLYANYSKAVEMAAKAKANIAYANHLPHLSEYYFYEALSILRGWDQWEDSALRGLKQRLHKAIKNFEKWSTASEENFLHQLYLIQAEYAKIQGKSDQALDLFNKSIHEAKRMGYHRNVAIGLEMIGDYYRSLGYDKVAKIFMMEARDKFLDWGAVVKAQHLQSLYPSYFSDESKVQTQRASVQAGETAVEKQPAELSSIIQSSQKMLEELDFKKILEQLLAEISKQSGAQKCVLLTKLKDSLYVEASLDVQDGFTFERKKMDELKLLPQDIIRFVSRTNKQVLLHDATEEGIYQSDPYIITFQPKSVMCIPLQLQGNIRGILYVENRWIKDVFANIAQDGIRHLATQALFMRSISESYEEQVEKAETNDQPTRPEIDPMDYLDEALTNREIEILNLMATGLSNQEIAEQVGLKIGTVKVHNHNIYMKLDVNRRAQAVVRAKELNLIP